MLAEAFLSCRWALDELDAHGKLVLELGRKHKWYTQLVSYVFERFPVAPQRHVLIEYIEGLASQRRVALRIEKLPSPTLLRLPRPAMRPASRLSPEINVPALVTTGELAEWLGLTVGELDWFEDRHRPADHFADSPLRHYRYRGLKKKSGNLRLLEIPKSRLKQIQRQILHQILDHIPPHSAAHAFRPGRSVTTYVAPHCNQPVVVHMDLMDFFPSIPASRVHAFWRTLGYPERVARSLTCLCTHRAREIAFSPMDGIEFDVSSRELFRQRHLPQGTPTSPALANLCAWRLDVRLTALAARFGATYSRYADDLLFSGGPELQRGVSRFRSKVLAIALDEGFSINVRKTRILLQSHSQRVAGVVLNAHPNPVREDYDRLKALLFNCVRYGPASQNRERIPNFTEHLLGRIAYLTMVNAQRGQKLQLLFDQIQWSELSPSDP
jgi:hypothetical protein